ncbi:MAG: hypothetical protein RL266_1998 [Bacteroidota bacterium]|jgi:branched-chain amino acid aminotransferase
MSRYQLFNGLAFPEEENLLHASNRGLFFGDGFFESVRIFNGRAPFAKLHWQRIVRACSMLHIELPETLTMQSFNQHLLALAKLNGELNSRVRFQGFRSGSGRYSPADNQLSWSMLSQAMDTDHFELNSKGLTVAVCNTHSINPAPQSSFKSSNSIPYVVASIFAAQQKLDDCFLLDSHGFLAEATGSNIFLVKGNKLLTPDLSNGGVAGVMRNVVLHQAEKMGLEVQTASLRTDDALAADECFLSNATRGLQWVGALDKKRYFKKVSERLLQQINQNYIKIN